MFEIWELSSTPLLPFLITFKFWLALTIFIWGDYFHLRWAIKIFWESKSITPTIFATIVHAPICSWIEYCNSLLMCLPKCHLSKFRVLKTRRPSFFKNSNFFISKASNMLFSHFVLFSFTPMAAAVLMVHYATSLLFQLAVISSDNPTFK